MYASILELGDVDVVRGPVESYVTSILHSSRDFIHESKEKKKITMGFMMFRRRRIRSENEGFWKGKTVSRSTIETESSLIKIEDKRKATVDMRGDDDRWER